MAGIVLKDGNGTEVEYEGTKRLKATYCDSEGNKKTGVYTRFSDMRAYILSTADGTNYKVEASITALGGDEGKAIEFSDEQIEEFGYDGSDGSRKLMVLLYPSSLTIGETIKLWDIIY